MWLLHSNDSNVACFCYHKFGFDVIHKWYMKSCFFSRTNASHFSFTFYLNFSCNWYMIFAALGLQIEGLKERRRMTFSGAVPHFYSALYFNPSFNISFAWLIIIQYSPISILFLIKFWFMVSFLFFIEDNKHSQLFLNQIAGLPIIKKCC